MHHLQINLTSLALILWSGMLIIAGSIWVLASQVRTLSDSLAARSDGHRADHVTEAARPTAVRAARQGSSVRVRATVRTGVATSRRALPTAQAAGRQRALQGRTAAPGAEFAES